MLKNRYFALDPKQSRLVRGAVGAAVYDFRGGTVIPVPPPAARLVVQTGNAFGIDERTPPDAGLFLDSLAARGLGAYGLILTEPQPADGLKPRIRPDFAWLELTQVCNLRCVHCYGSFGQKPASASARLSDTDWVSVLAQVRQNGFDRIQFIGGEPLLHPALIELLFAASGYSFSFIEVFSNLLLLDDQMLNALSANRANLATTLYSVEEQVHDQVTTKKGSFKETINAIRRAREWGIPVRVSCIVNSANEGRLGDMQRFVEDLGAAYGGQDQARPTGRGAAASCRTTVPRRLVNPPFRTSRIEFDEAHHFNPCWKGKIAVTDDGSVLPCVFSRGHIAGNLRERPLAELMASPNMDRYWSMTKDKVQVCRDCEFRYACFDCRPLALGWNGGELSAKTHGCNYDPHTTKWG